MELLPKVYVAGAYSADNVTAVLRNIRDGLKLAERVLATKMAAPFAPWLDWQFEMFGDHEVSTYYNYSYNWLIASDVVLVRRYGSETSHGTQKEIELAGKYGIKVFFDDEWPQFVEYIKELHGNLNKEQVCESKTS